MIFRAKHYQTEQMVDVCCNDGKIVSVEKAGNFVPDHQAAYIAPAFFDLQSDPQSDPQFDLLGRLRLWKSFDS